MAERPVQRLRIGHAFALVVTLLGTLLESAVTAQQRKPAAPAPAQSFVRDPRIPIDEEYTKKIKEYTTEPFFTSPLVDYLPASKTVPTPKAVLGDVAGAPGKLPYAEEVYQYMRMLEKAAPQRVKVYSIGRTEEGREMIAVAVSSEANMAKLEENRARLGKLADPRTINLDDQQAEKVIAGAVPVYYITGTIHSPETGAPTALMELAYRLAVDDHGYIKAIRDNTTLTAGFVLGLAIIITVNYARSPWRKLPPGLRRLPILGNALQLRDKSWLLSKDCKERFGESSDYIKR